MAKFRAQHSESQPSSACCPRLRARSNSNPKPSAAIFREQPSTERQEVNTLAAQSTIVPAPTVTPIGKTGRKADLNRVMIFQFDPLVYRMVDKYKWTEAESRECFEDLKRFLYMAVIADKPVAPTEKLDEMWHNFILYTLDYAEFCMTHLSLFVHHRPRRRDDSKSTRNMRQETMDFARELFGYLPANFQYTHAEMFKASNDCVNSCSHSAPSTNCQS